VADLLRILFLVPLAFIAAVLAATATILVGWYGHEPGMLSDAGTTGFVIGVGVFVLLRVGALAFVPAFVVAVLAELFGWRSVFLYLAVGGALGFGAGQLPLLGWQGEGDGLLLPAAGFVGGLAYWLLAGRFAGIARPGGPPPAAPPVPPAPPTSPG
jgi:hypothetical protein